MLLELNQKEAECVGGSRQSSKLRYQRRPFYSPPRQRQKWGDDVALQHSEWGDLFYDLFYVAAAYNLGNLLTSSLEPDLYKKGVMYFVAIFGSLYIAWEESVLYQSRYATGDYFHQFVNILRILFVSLSIIHIDPIYIMSDPSSADNVSPCCSYVAGSFGGDISHTCLHLYLRRHLHSSRAKSNLSYFHIAQNFAHAFLSFFCSSISHSAFSS